MTPTPEQSFAQIKFAEPYRRRRSTQVIVETGA